MIPRTEDLLEDVLEEQKSRAEEKLASKQRADPVKYRKYTVKPGDSLWTIASANNLSIDSLYGTNILRTPDRLSPGIVLRIPNQDGLSVKIAKGQTLNALAKKYGVAERAIRMANGLADKVELNAGQEVFIPGASQSIAVYRGSSSGGGMSRTAPPVAKAATGAAFFLAGGGKNLQSVRLAPASDSAGQAFPRRNRHTRAPAYSDTRLARRPGYFLRLDERLWKDGHYSS